MTYKVHIADSAVESAMAAYAYIHADSPLNADRWMDRLLLAIDSLEHFPRRCKVAPESDDVLIEIRQLLVGGYRILFAIEGREVRVFHVRHASQLPLPPDAIP